MTLTEDQANQIGNEEDDRWVETHVAIVAERRRTHSDFNQDRVVARKLTSELVAVRRDEDKAMLASDEAVAHALVKLRKGKRQQHLLICCGNWG